MLSQAVAALDWTVSGKDPQVQVSGFGASSIDLIVAVWIDDPWRAQQLRSELNLTIWDALRAHGIAIPFPQLDVHLPERQLIGVVPETRA